MKKLLPVFVAIIAMVLLPACGSATPAPAASTPVPTASEAPTEKPAPSVKITPQGEELNNGVWKIDSVSLYVNNQEVAAYTVEGTSISFQFLTGQGWSNPELRATLKTEGEIYPLLVKSESLGLDQLSLGTVYLANGVVFWISPDAIPEITIPTPQG